MARKVHWQYIYVVRNENGEEIAEVSTLEAALAMVGGNPSGGDAGCVMELNNGVRQVPESQNDSEESSRDPNASSLEPHQEEPRPSAEPVIRIPRRRSSRRRRRTTLKFTLGQVEEMEKLFKETQYPDALARKELAQALTIPEVKVKTWFNNKRAKQRASEKKVMLRSAPPGIQDHISMKDVEEP
ncbi:homeobox protein Rhox13-like [Peromyscus californicus insignis]|uniref:homeobox protein Rhox13-like n=1 Tax=Peromyscus californicus insignis TaxID=564181 RepID=UPI0022A6F1B4|nr:homeobox protein Rhox13-like [Peromyscus californicus insignis]